MRARLLLAFICIVSLVLSSSVRAQGLRPGAAGDPLLLNTNLGTEPPTLDPALSTDTTSHLVIEQLFSGLVDLDDATAEVRPDLATHWSASADSTVYTFTLRSDARWSDGSTVTAQDVRYGILRTLNPATRSDVAYMFYVIKNAEGYNKGSVTDASQVGVTALNPTTLRITLEYPAAYALSILAQPGARPMPQATIEAYGVPTWTLPAHIVTNGPYRLTAWAHNDHILLDKNPTYYAAAQVQIEQVWMGMVGDEHAAWTMYLNGQLDTVSVPSGATPNPPVLYEMHTYAHPCTYYYGFSISQPPFDKALVRKAFSAATDRQGMINSALGGGPKPAQTYTPPGVLGHVDGASEGVGIPYNPTQARQWLAEAGYPNGQGLPAITLWFNTGAGHQAIAEHIRNTWYTTLGVSVTLQSLPWQTYIGQVGTGRFQVWRNGWCSDYLDAYNFLHEGINRSSLGNWHNAAYEDLLSQAARQPEPALRQALYKQAERILVETEAVVLPLYYFVSRVVTKPYLLRSYGAATPDLATWRITRVQQVIPTGGGTLRAPDTTTTLGFPQGAFGADVVVTYTPATPYAPGSPALAGAAGAIMRTAYVDIGHCFSVTAVYSATSQAAAVTPGRTYTITVQYSDAERGLADEGTLALYGWDGSRWIKEASSKGNPLTNQVTATPNRLGLWTVLGEQNRVYLPLVWRNG